MPIHVATNTRKLSTSKKWKRLSTPLCDDHGHPDPKDTWEYMLPKVKAGRLLRKHKYYSPSLTAVGISFGNEYDEYVHGKNPRKKLNLYHISTHWKTLWIPPPWVWTKTTLYRFHITRISRPWSKFSLTYGKRIFSTLGNTQKLCQDLGRPFKFSQRLLCIKGTVKLTRPPLYPPVSLSLYPSVSLSGCPYHFLAIMRATRNCTQSMRTQAMGSNNLSGSIICPYAHPSGCPWAFCDFGFCINLQCGGPAPWWIYFRHSRTTINVGFILGGGFRDF